MPELLRTHPVSEKRSAKIHKELPEAREVYRSAGCNERQQGLLGMLRRAGMDHRDGALALEEEVQDLHQTPDWR